MNINQLHSEFGIALIQCLQKNQFKCLYSIQILGTHNLKAKEIVPKFYIQGQAYIHQQTRTNTMCQMKDKQNITGD